MKDAIRQAIARRDASWLRSLAERVPTEQEQAVLQLLADLIDSNRADMVGGKSETCRLAKKVA